MTKKRSSYIMAGILAASLYAPFVEADYSLPPLPQQQQQGNITYLTGGIGDEERDAMRSVRHDYNLSITSAAASGAFEGDTHIIIRNRKSGQELLNADAGPLFYAKLPPGHYVIQGAVVGQATSKDVTIPSGNSSKHVRFYWK